MLLQLRSVAECELHCLRGSPVGRNAMPEIPSSKASTFLSRSEFAPLRHSAATSIRSAVAGVVSGCNLNIQGMFIEVSVLSAANATTGTKFFRAICSARWLES